MTVSRWQRTISIWLLWASSWLILVLGATFVDNGLSEPVHLVGAVCGLILFLYEVIVLKAQNRKPGYPAIVLVVLLVMGVAASFLCLLPAVLICEALVPRGGSAQLVNVAMVMVAALLILPLAYLVSGPRWFAESQKDSRCKAGQGKLSL